MAKSNEPRRRRQASHEFIGVDSTEAHRNRIEKTVRYGGDDVGLGTAEARMVDFGPKLSSGEASANYNFRAFNRQGLPNRRIAVKLCSNLGERVCHLSARRKR